MYKDRASQKKVSGVRQKDHRTYLVINTIGYLGIGVHFALIPLFFLLGMKSLS